MPLIDKSASPPSKLDAILDHLTRYQPAVPQKDRVGSATIDIASCLVNLDYHQFGLRSYAEMKFHLDTLIDRELIDVVGDAVFELQEFNRKIRFPQRVRIHRRVQSLRPQAREMHMESQL